MKPFDLAAALAGAPVVTRDGRRVLKIVDMGMLEYPLAASIQGSRAPGGYRADGKYYGDNADSCADLFMASTKRTFYANILKEPIGGAGSKVAGWFYCTREEAERAHKSEFAAIAAAIEVEL